MEENSYVSFLYSASLLRRVRLVVSKKQKYFLLPHQQLPKNMVLVFGSYERTKKG